ncbi:MAG TPA: hypothetical protein VGC67_10750 [Cellulomonas sp.]
MTRRRTLAAAVVVVAALLAGCASGPSQEERVAAAIEAYDTVTDLTHEDTELVSETFPDLDLALSDPDDSGTWHSCGDASYSWQYDSPETAKWGNGWVYVLTPREPTAPLVAPLAQTYVEHGWTITADYLTEHPAELILAKDGYRLSINGTDQDYLDRQPADDARLTVYFTSPCLCSPANLTEWDRMDPHDFDLPSGPG